MPKIHPKRVKTFIWDQETFNADMNQTSCQHIILNPSSFGSKDTDMWADSTEQFLEKSENQPLKRKTGVKFCIRYVHY